MKLAHSATYSFPPSILLNLDITNSRTEVLQVLTASNFSDLVDTTILLFSVLQNKPPNVPSNLPTTIETYLRYRPASNHTHRQPLTNCFEHENLSQ